MLTVEMMNLSFELNLADSDEREKLKQFVADMEREYRLW